MGCDLSFRFFPNPQPTPCPRPSPILLAFPPSRVRRSRRISHGLTSGGRGGQRHGSCFGSDEAMRPNHPRFRTSNWGIFCTISTTKNMILRLEVGENSTYYLQKDFLKNTGELYTQLKIRRCFEITKNKTPKKRCMTFRNHSILRPPNLYDKPRRPHAAFHILSTVHL